MRGWVAAGDLQPGEPLVTLGGGTGSVVWVHVVPGQADRYNLTVAHDHTYAVGAGLWVVHNTCGGNAGPAKGSAGVTTAQDILEAQGYPPMQQEVNFRTPGGNPKVDMVSVDRDTLYAVEVKNGLTAKLSRIQRNAYPFFTKQDVGNIVPFGPNAVSAGLTPGVSLQAQGINRIVFIFLRLNV